MSYADDHAGALADVKQAGAALTFTSASPGTYTPATDTYSSPTTATVAGQAVRVRGDPNQYQALGLVESEAPTVLFVPTTYGGKPLLGSTATWGGVVRTVKSADPIAPDGTAIAWRVVLK